MLEVWMEVNLPWWLNNGIKWVVGLMGMHFMLLKTAFDYLIIPFDRGFWDGSSQYDFPWNWDWSNPDD